ncbi:MAG: protoheme IX farnesyltransferase [Bacteroidales bacterium]|nr:protoheme IX farnesyltransferase [Bacteroidales bacterium]
MGSYLQTLAELAKVRITFAVSLTTATGYLLARERFDAGIILPAAGIFLLACGSSALNHFQERDKDALMERTRNRPIPSGRVSPAGALLIALLLSLSGAGLLYLGAGLLAMQLGLLALIWYNGIYTPLKRRSAFAVVPGAVIGSIPPLAGWVAGGGSLADPHIPLLAFFFFIWQVPHFWLLMLKYGKEYESAGFPSITSLYSTSQIRNTTFIWTMATAVTALMLPVFGIVSSLTAGIAVLASAIWLIISFIPVIRTNGTTVNPKPYFMKINYFILAIILTLSLDSLG